MPDGLRAKSKRSRQLLAAAVGLAGMLLSLAMFGAWRTRQRWLIEAQFDFDAEQRAGIVERCLAADFEALGSLAAFFRASQSVEKDEFHDFAAPLMARRPAIEALGFAALDDDASGAPRVAFLHARDGAPLAVGFELGSRADLRAAIDRAVRTRSAAGVPWEPASAGSASAARWFGVVPAFGRPSPRSPEGESAGAPSVGDSGVERPVGVLFGLFRLGDVIERAVASNQAAGIDLYLFDLSDPSRPRLLASRPSAPGGAAAPIDSLPPETPEVKDHRARFAHAGPPWVLYAVPTERYWSERRSPLPPTVLLCGWLVSALLALYVHGQLGRWEQVERLVVERTGQLQQASADLAAEVAERRRTERILRDSEALYSSLVENLPVQVLRKDLAGRFTFANQSFCRLLGRPLSEILGKTDYDFYPAELADKYRKDDRRVAETGELFEDEERYEKDGRTRYNHVMKSPVRDASGRIIGTQAVFWDVTERHRAEEALDRERYLLHTLMDNLPDAIYFKDRQSRFLRISRALAEKFGLIDPAEAAGKTDADFFTAEHAQQALADERELIETGRAFVDKEEKETWPDGRETWVSTTKLPLRDQDGRVVGTFGISRDISQQKHAAETLRLAKEAAEAANRAKSAFLANMSHEIRTPLNAIIGMTEMVLESPLSKEQREHLLVVRDSGEALLSLINDILDFSKIEAERLELESVPFDLYETIGDTMKWLALRAHDKGLELACRFAPDVPAVVAGDATRLRQVVVNLVGNAIKFTEAGEVVLEVRQTDRGADHVVIEFAVTDTGIGIPEDMHEAIFGLFVQGDATTTRRYGGTGLGLAICARLVELMGGRIEVQSRVGHGSTFRFAVRFGAVEQEIPRSTARHIARVCGTRALVVDDNATNRRILLEMLENWRLRPAAAADVPTAIAMLDEGRRGGDEYRVVITDAHMPDHDGFSLAERIRGEPMLHGTVIMMLTSGDHPDDIAKCRRLGIGAYLVKPVKQSELFDALLMALGVATAEDEEAGVLVEAPHRVRPLRVLLAEDSVMSQKLVVGLLTRCGHVVTVANNGKAAVDRFKAESFDLVLMDVQMPEMDGLSATSAIRAWEAQRGTHVPIIAMTAHAMRGDRERCLAAGMDDYVAKPIHIKDLIDAIERVVGAAVCCGGGASGATPAETGQQPAGAAGAAESREPPVESEPIGAAHDGAAAGHDADRPSPAGLVWPPEPSASAALGAIDPRAALRTVRGDRHLLAGLFETFLEEAPPLGGAIRQAIAQGDVAATRRAAHQLKTALRYVGAELAAERVERIEQSGKAEDLAEAAAHWAAVEPVLPEILAAVRAEKASLEHAAGSESGPSVGLPGASAQDRPDAPDGLPDPRDGSPDSGGGPACLPPEGERS